MKKLLVIYTGGTIGMMESDQGLIPDDQLPNKILNHNIANNQPLDIMTLTPLIDSAAMNGQHWQRLIDSVNDLFDPNHHYGVIILHGTDTLAYSAALLSFWFGGHDFPIILTGAMQPIGDGGPDDMSDGWDNLLLSIQMANRVSHGVYVCFAGETIHAARVSKLYANQQAAFQAPNGNQRFIRSAHYEQPTMALKAKRIDIITLHPLVDETMLVERLDRPLDGLILRTYGSGTVPDLPTFYARLALRNHEGLLTVVTTQSAHGAVQFGKYAITQDLAQSDSVSAGDMCDEAALVKLFYILHLNLSPQEQRVRFAHNMLGEMSKMRAHD